MPPRRAVEKGTRYCAAARFPSGGYRPLYTVRGAVPAPDADAPGPPSDRTEEKAGHPAMFDSLNDDKLRAAHDAARLLCENDRALGLDPLAIKLDTLRVDIAVELENRGKPVTTADHARPVSGGDAYRQADDAT